MGLCEKSSIQGKDFIRQRNKKLIGGIRYGFYIGDNDPWDCKTCTAKHRDVRNCHNHRKLRQSIVLKEEWSSVSAKIKPVLKVGDLKFYVCPVSAISKQTWAVLGIVNETTDGDCNILHLPFVGTIFDQPDWYRTAVKIVKSERANHQRERLKRGK